MKMVSPFSFFFFLFPLFPLFFSSFFLVGSFACRVGEGKFGEPWLDG